MLTTDDKVAIIYAVGYVVGVIVWSCIQIFSKDGVLRNNSFGKEE